MAYVPFFHICPEIAKKETRVITILQNENEYGLPKGDYGFIELFCDECDCRRVFFQVFLNEVNVANIAYGWGSLAFYRKEFEGFSEKAIIEIKGPTLDSFQYQSGISGKIMVMFNKLLFTDKDYLARIEKHYEQFKKMI